MPLSSIFGQTFSPQDIPIVAVLVVLEGALSIDNALVLGILARRVELDKRRAVLTYGLIGAAVIRLVALLLAAYLVRLAIVTWIAALYLIWIAARHFLRPKRCEKTPDQAPAGFWPTVFAIEMTDLVFAIDSILAAVALVGPSPRGSLIHPKLWVIFLGGMLGVILVRCAAARLARLIDRFPRLQSSAYLLVLVIGLKLLIQAAFHLRFESPAAPEFWIFWAAVILCLLPGLIFRPQT